MQCMVVNILPGMSHTVFSLPINDPPPQAKLRDDALGIQIQLYVEDHAPMFGTTANEKLLAI